MTTVKLPRDFKREAMLAAKRYDALRWMYDRGTPEALAVYGWDGIRAALREADAYADELGRIADGQ